jgi:hypothetical protein
MRVELIDEERGDNKVRDFATYFEQRLFHSGVRVVLSIEQAEELANWLNKQVFGVSIQPVSDTTPKS